MNLDNTDIRKRITYNIIRNMYARKIVEEESLVDEMKEGQYEHTYGQMVKSILNELVREGIIMRKNGKVYIPEMVLFNNKYSNMEEYFRKIYD